MKIKRKVGIITYFHFYNYGTMLQAYALLYISEKFGKDIECEVVNYKFGEKTIKSRLDLLKIRIKRFQTYILEFNRVLTIYLYRSDIGRKRKYFDDFLKKNFKLSTKEYTYNSDLEIYPPDYNVYITGSDQTWSPKIGFNPALFLDFARGGIKAAYAPSVGVTSFTESEEAFLKDNLSKYSYLSCRETIGSELLSKITSKKVQVVLDPTLMLVGDEWRKLAVKPKITHPYILCYFLGNRLYYRDFVKQLKKQTGYEVYFIPVSYVDCKRTNNLLFDVGPAEFLGLIDNAAFVCTDSFHGLCFSVNLKKDFYAFVKHAGSINGGDNSRIYDVLSRMGLLYRLQSKFEKENIELNPIDYLQVYRLLDAEREISKHFLQTILNDKHE